MKEHIVKNGETIEKIMFIYSATKDELLEANKHIKNVDNLIPGTKLKIPIITKVVDDDMMNLDPFIEDYYEINEELFDEKEETFDKKEELNTIEEKEEINTIEKKEERDTIEDKKEEEKTSTPKINYYPCYFYNPYTNRYYVYYYPYQKR